MDGLDLRVPMSPIQVELLGCDGTTRRGKFFLPTQSARHSGPTRVSERMNDAIVFLPFLPDDETQSILVNKSRLLCVTVAVADDANEDDDAADELPRRRIALACGAFRFEGDIVVDMPQNKTRMLDYLNRTGDFVMVREGESYRFVQKSHIDCVTELCTERS